MTDRSVLIAHVIHRLAMGGLENGLVNLINRLPPDRYRHAIICMTDATDFRQRIVRPDVEVFSLHKAPGKDWPVYHRLWRLLRLLRPDIVHTRNLATLDCQLVAWLAGVPGRVHGEHGWDTPDLHGRLPRYLRLRRVVGWTVHGFVAMSRHIERWLTEVVRIAPCKVTQIYNGVDVLAFAPAIARNAPADGARSPPVVIGSVGRLEAVKDPGTLVTAFAQLVHGDERMGEVRLRFIGDGSLRGTLEQRARAAGIAAQCEFVGARDDVANELRRLDIFVLTSLNEGISNTILEAMAAGLPVVATDVGGNPELVVPGLTGALVPAAEPEALAAALRRYVLDAELRHRQGAAARRCAVELFAIDAMVGRYAELYESLLSRSALPHWSLAGPGESCVE